MPPRSNTKKTNVRKEPPPKKPEKATKSRKPVMPKIDGPKINSPKIAKVTGFFFMLFSIYLLLAIISFFSNWFDAIQVGSNLTHHFESVGNWTGQLGVFLSRWFVLKGTGIGSLFFPILFIVNEY